MRKKKPVANTPPKLELQRPIVFLDTETTGTDPKKDYIVELAMKRISPEGDAETFESYVKPPISIPPGATKVHGITDETVADAPNFKDISTEVLHFLDGNDIAGFNSNRFDIPLLYNELKRAGILWAWQKSSFIDVGNIYKIKEPRTLGAAYKFYTGVDHTDAHKAMNDVDATVEVFWRQRERYEDFGAMTVDQIALASNFDKRIVDITGSFGYNDANEIIFNFGKWKDARAKDHKDYLQWMLKPTSGFDDDVKRIAESLLYS